MAFPTAPSSVASESDSASGTGPLTCSADVAVTAGDLIVVSLHWEGADTTVSVVDDDAGGSNTYNEVSFTGGHPNAGGEPWGAVFWAIAKANNASLGISGSWAAARTFRGILAVPQHPDAAGTISLDGTPNGAGGVGAAIATGNITTNTQAANCGIAFTVFAGYGDNPTSEQINGVAADTISNISGSYNELWQLRYTSGFTGQGTASQPSNNWAAGIVAFKIVAGGSGGQQQLEPWQKHGGMGVMLAA